MKKFKVLEMAKIIAKETIELTRKLNYDSAELKKQLIRSVTSVPLNIAEANGRRGKDKSYHFNVAYSSAKESIVNLELLVMLGLVCENKAKFCLSNLDQICAMLYKLNPYRG